MGNSVRHKYCRPLCEKRDHIPCRRPRIQIDKILRSDQRGRISGDPDLLFPVHFRPERHLFFLCAERFLRLHSSPEDLHKCASLVKRIEIAPYRRLGGPEMFRQLCHRDAPLFLQQSEDLFLSCFRQHCPCPLSFTCRQEKRILRIRFSCFSAWRPACKCGRHLPSDIFYTETSRRASQSCSLMITVHTLLRDRKMQRHACM